MLAQKADVSGVLLAKGYAPRRTLWWRIWRARIAYILIAPAIISYLVFFFYPVAHAFVASFARYDGFTMKFDRELLHNYKRAFRDPAVPTAFLNVVRFVAVAVVGGQILSLFTALLLNGLAQGVGFYRTIYYIPAITSVVTIATTFRWVFAADPSSPANLVLRTVGLKPIRWLAQPALFIPIAGIVAIWAGLGGSTIIWMAGLKGIPREYYEAATVDGADSKRKFWSITLPLLKPVILFQSVMGLIGGMKEFGLVFVMSSGVPMGTANYTPVLMIYKYGFERFQMDYASALAFLLTIVLVVLTLLQLKVSGREITYE